MERIEALPKKQLSLILRLTLAITIMGGVMVAVAGAQTEVEPGFNLFSTESEIEIGRESAMEVEQQLPVLRDGAVEDYVERVGARLARQAPGADYPYQFKVLNLAEVNAFALPGGFMYVNRGLLESVRNEGELAGVLAHEISHVALRHSTNQASKAYLAQAGLSVLGGIFGGDSTAHDILGAVGGVGVPLLFLKFSRSAEEQADTLGAQIMAQAGYDPSSLASFFAHLDQQGGGGPPEFLSSHPSYENRQENIRREAELVEPVRQTGAVGELPDIQARLERMASAPTMDEVQKGNVAQAPPARTERGTAEVRTDNPSSRFETFTQRRGYYQISHPDNWRAYEARDGFGVTLAPQGGIVETSTGRQEIIYGVIVNHYEPFEPLRGGSRSLGSLGFRSGSDFESGVSRSLETATRDILMEILDTNPHLQPVRDSLGSRIVDRQPAVTADLAGTSPVTRREERVSIVTRDAGDGHVLYVLLVAPAQNYEEVARGFDRMIESLRVDDGAVHTES